MSQRVGDFGLCGGHDVTVWELPHRSAALLERGKCGIWGLQAPAPKGRTRKMADLTPSPPLPLSAQRGTHAAVQSTHGHAVA